MNIEPIAEVKILQEERKMFIIFFSLAWILYTIWSYNLDVHFLSNFTQLTKTNITIAHSPGFSLSSARVCVENKQPVPTV